MCNSFKIVLPNQENPFDWITHHPYPPLRHVKTSWSIWPDGNGSHFMVMGSDKPKPARSLNECVQGAMGVSRSSSHHIPRLLTSAITGFALVDLADLRLLGEELFEGVRCHRLQGAHPRRGVYQLWVGQTDFLIRRIMIEGSTVPPTEEIHREIRINGEISPGALQGKR